MPQTKLLPRALFPLLALALFCGIHGMKAQAAGVGTLTSYQIAPTSAGNIYGSYPTSFVPFNGDLYFVADPVGDGANEQFYRFNNGSPVAVGPLFALGNFSFEGPTALTPMGSVMIFRSSDLAGSNGGELWMFDPSQPAASQFTKIDLQPGAASSNPTGFNVIGTKCFINATGSAFNNSLTATGGNIGRQLYVFDSTTKKVTSYNINNSGPAVDSSPLNFVSFNSDVYFTATITANNPQIWRFNNGAPTKVSNFAAYLAAEGGGISDLTPVGSLLYFRATDVVNSHNDDELWVYDPAVPSFQKFNLNPAAGLPNAQSSYPIGFNVIGTKIYINATGNNFANSATAGGTYIGRELYVVDAPNKKITTYTMGVNPSNDCPLSFTSFNSDVYFTVQANAGNSIHQIWRFNNGTPVHVTSPFDGVSGGNGVGNFTPIGNYMYMTGTDIVATKADNELWGFDPSAAAGSQFVKFDINTATASSGNNTSAPSSYPSYFTVYNNTLFVNASGFNFAGSTTAGATFINNEVYVLSPPGTGVAPSSFSAGGPPPAKGTVGAAYAGYTFAANGTPAPTYALAPTSSALPGGITLSAAGVLSGTPTASGTFSNIIVRASNATGVLNTSAFTLTIAAAMTISPASMPQATVGASYNQTATVSNGTTPYVSLTVTGFSAGGTGLTTPVANLGAGTVTISGTPSAAGTVSFTVNATDTVGATLTKAYSVTVNAVLSIAPASLAQGTAGTVYNHTATVSNGTKPYTTFSVSGFTAGTTGISAPVTNAAGGTVTLNSTPNASGSASFTLNVTDTAGATLSKSYTVTVNPALSIAPASLPQTTAGVLYNQTATVTNGTTPYTTFSVTGFNAGGTGLGAPTTNSGAGTITLNSTPSAAGSATFTVNVTDTAGAILTKAYTVTVNAPMTIAPASMPQATVGTSYSQTFTVSNGTPGYPFMTVTGFNDGGTGLTTLSQPGGPGTNLIMNGTPTAAGTASFTVNVTDSVGATLTKAYTVTVNGALSIAPASLPGGTSGVLYNQTVTVSNGSQPYAAFAATGYNAGGTGVAAPTLNSAAGTITFNSTPTASGTVSFTVDVTDAAGATLSKAYSFTVITVTLTPTTLPTDTEGVAYNQVVTVNNGALPYNTINVTGFSAGTTGLSVPAVDSNAGTFTISGTPTAGTVAFTLNVVDANGGSASQSYSITVNPPVTLTASLPDSTVGALYSQVVTAANGTGNKSMSVGSFNDGGTGLASPAAGANTVTFNSTPTAPGTVTFSVTATDTVGAQAVQNYSFKINPPISYGALSVTQWTVNQSGYSGTIALSNGTGGYSNLIATGVPAGLNAVLFSNLGQVQIIGTPTAVVSTLNNVSITVQDSVGVTSTSTFTLAINPAPVLGALSVTKWTVQNPGYSGTIAVSNGTGAYGNLVATGVPAGLSAVLAGSTVTISGTPAAVDSTPNNVSISVDDAVGSNVTSTYTLTINPAIVFAPFTANQWTAGQPGYSNSVSASNGTGTLAYSVTSGALPAGLALDSVTGAITGTPSAAGSFNFTITATDSVGATATQTSATTINPPIALTPLTLPPGLINQTYTQTIVASGGTGAKVFSVSAGALPAGLNLAASTGVLTGTISTPGIYNFSILATDTVGATAVNAYSLTINIAIVVSPALLPNAQIGVSYNQAFSASGGTAPYTYAVTGALPAGLSVSSTGVISGIPTAGGPSSFNITVTDGNNFNSVQSFSLTVNAPVITVSPATLPNGAVGTAYNQTLSGNAGTAPYTFTISAGALPPGLSLSAAGVVSGTPSSGGTFNITATATDSSTGTGPFSGSQSYVIKVPPGIVTQPASTSIFAGLTATLSVAGSGAGLSFQWFQGNTGDVTQPVAGATASTFTTPALVVTTNYWVRVSNSGGATDSVTAIVTVTRPPAPTVTSPPQVTGTVIIGEPVTVTIGNPTSISGTPEVLVDFGDGTPPSSTLTHTYTVPGIYTVTITLTSPHGESVTFTQTVFVSGTLTDGATPPGFDGILIGAGGLSQDKGGLGLLVVNHAVRERSRFVGRVKKLQLIGNVTQADLAGQAGTLTIGKGPLAVPYNFEMNKVGNGTGSLVRLHVDTHMLTINVMGPEALTTAAEAMTKSPSNGKIYVPATVVIANKVFLAFTFELKLKGKTSGREIYTLTR